ncbi:hypothetical protein [Chitinophaga sp. 22620]|uniref:hypothetical protein n=1 Tax=Chitinophaga sp. 22620 TaxID=3453952 RepID=UPI003F873140
MKNQRTSKDEIPVWLKIAGSAGVLLFGVYPILSKSFRLLADIRLQRLGNTETSAWTTGYLESNVGVMYYAIMVLVGYWIAMKLDKKPLRLKWAILTVIPVCLALMGYFVWQDFPKPSPRADLISEIMVIIMFAPFFPFIVNFVATSISKKEYGQKFWFITLGYGIFYLFFCPALIGDIITILTI